MLTVSEAEIIWRAHPGISCYRESIKALEVDVQHANALAAALPSNSGGNFVQMELSYSPLAPILVHFFEWLDCSCTDNLPNYLGLLQILVYKVYVDGMRAIPSEDRRASLKEFYAIIYPSLVQLRDNFQTTNDPQTAELYGAENSAKLQCKDTTQEDECTICMDGSNEIALPNCCHSMCSNCFQDWNWRSQTCPFCRGSLESIKVGDLWILTSVSNVIDTVTLARQNLQRFYRYIQSLPLLMPENHIFIFDYLI